MATIEIDGKEITVDDNKMIIEVADEAGIDIPRFCYHKKLSIAANCRMCLVEVEKAPKPMPACATPINDGMKVFTKSPKAIAAQKAVMEFLLINHPLDCPICDQGGECELQDVSMGYGKDVSRYTEKKRVVEDENLGSLIATDMTRCIHCTRCVRFGEEVAGLRELGATDRGEQMRIGTFVEHSMRSEVSGNIIDLCPVGALTSKPFRFAARSWEMEQVAGISPHDCLGSNIFLHTRRQKVMRVVPSENETINETWISDRDRFSYDGLHHEDRIAHPMVKQDNGSWHEVDWETALVVAIKGLQKAKTAHGAENIAALAHQNSTTEEFYLLQKFMRTLGSDNIDHRCQASDFQDQEHEKLFPGMSTSYESFNQHDSYLLIGSDLQREQPLAAVKLRKAIGAGAKVSAVNPRNINNDFTIHHNQIVATQQFANRLAEIAKALSEKAKISKEAKQLLSEVTVSDEARTVAEQLSESDKPIIVLGAIANNHYQASILRSLSQLIAELANAEFANMTVGCNSAGAWLAGALPHRNAAGQANQQAGLDAYGMFGAKLPAYLLLNVEPDYDCANPALALEALNEADFVLSISAYQNDAMLKYANVILPLATFSETSGSYVNVEGSWQSFTGAVKPFEEARPAWKILRVLANLANMPGFDYESSQDVFDELQKAVDSTKFKAKGWYCPPVLPGEDNTLRRISQWGIYKGDAIVRRSHALQNAASRELPMIHVHPNVAKQFNLRNGKEASAIQSGVEAPMLVCIDENMPDGCVYIPAGCKQSANLGDTFGEIDLK